MTALISSAELENILFDDHLVILNGSWHMPAEQRNASAEHEKAHIPGAVFFDIDAISDTKSPYPHMLPDEKTFEDAAAKLGISNNSDIVVYDSTGLFSAARVWWMLRVFGHKKVRVLDGGLPKWLAEVRAMQSGNLPHIPGIFKATFNPSLVRSFEQVQTNTQSRKEQVIDARAAGRFNGTDPEPRPGLRSGHIEGSYNIPFRECTVPPHHTLKPKAELAALFAERGIDVSKPLATTCGSGVTACVLALALYELGAENVPVYDGAWAEWGSRVPA